MLGELTRSAIKIADQAVSDVTTTNVQHSERILTVMGKYVIKDKAEDVARELSYVFKGKKTDDYARLRRDTRLRAIAIQAIHTPTRYGGIYGFI